MEKNKQVSSKRLAELSEIIVAPIISEKSTLLAEKHRTISFYVRMSATRTSVKQAVEQLFSVQVENVNLSRLKPKHKRFRGRLGTLVNRKKAFVKVAAGQDINFAETLL